MWAEIEFETSRSVTCFCPRPSVLATCSGGWVVCLAPWKMARVPWARTHMFQTMNTSSWTATQDEDHGVSNVAATTESTNRTWSHLSHEKYTWTILINSTRTSPLLTSASTETVTRRCKTLTGPCYGGTVTYAAGCFWNIIMTLYFSRNRRLLDTSTRTNVPSDPWEGYGSARDMERGLICFRVGPYWYIIMMLMLVFCWLFHASYPDANGSYWEDTVPCPPSPPPPSPPPYCHHHPHHFPRHPHHHTTSPPPPSPESGYGLRTTATGSQDMRFVEGTTTPRTVKGGQNCNTHNIADPHWVMEFSSECNRMSGPRYLNPRRCERACRNGVINWCVRRWWSADERRLSRSTTLHYALRVFHSTIVWTISSE